MAIVNLQQIYQSVVTFYNSSATNANGFIQVTYSNPINKIYNCPIVHLSTLQDTLNLAIGNIKKDLNSYIRIGQTNLVQYTTNDIQCKNVFIQLYSAEGFKTYCNQNSLIKTKFSQNN
jgi:hypothetical protein